MRKSASVLADCPETGEVCRGLNECSVIAHGAVTRATVRTLNLSISSSKPKHALERWGAHFDVGFRFVSVWKEFFF